MDPLTHERIVQLEQDARLVQAANDHLAAQVLRKVELPPDELLELCRLWRASAVLKGAIAEGPDHYLNSNTPRSTATKWTDAKPAGPHTKIMPNDLELIRYLSALAADVRRFRDAPHGTEFTDLFNIAPDKLDDAAERLDALTRDLEPIAARPGETWEESKARFEHAFTMQTRDKTHRLIRIGRALAAFAQYEPAGAPGPLMTLDTLDHLCGGAVDASAVWARWGVLCAQLDIDPVELLTWHRGS